MAVAAQRQHDVRGCRGVEQTHYGRTPDEIADGIIAEWQAAGGGDPPYDWLWFVTRDVLETTELYT